MSHSSTGACTHTTKFIRAPRGVLYRAFTDPKALPVFLPPGEMTGAVHQFDGQLGGGYRMSLYYPTSEKVFRGKSSEREDRFAVRFVELTPSSRIAQAVTFDSADPAFAGEMTMVVTFAEADGGTEVTIACQNIPRGIRPEDNDTGCSLTLEKLARYVERAETG